MKTLGIFEAKTKFSAVVEDVASTGGSYLVTKKGQPVVEIRPARTSREDLLNAAEGLRRLARGIAAQHGSASADEVREMLNEGRRLE